MKVELTLGINEVSHSVQAGFQFVWSDDIPKVSTGWDFNLTAKLPGLEILKEKVSACFILVKDDTGLWVDVYHQIKPFRLEKAKVILDHSVLLLKIHPDGTITLYGLDGPHWSAMGWGKCRHSLYDQYELYIKIRKVFVL